MKHDYDSGENKWVDRMLIEESERTKLRSENSRLHRELEECREVLREVIEALNKYETEKENLNFRTVMRIGAAMERARRHQELEECRKVLKEIIAKPERTGYYWIKEAHRLVNPRGR
jgi:CRISPR/Cas system CSM-associated protein Csm2 small subunit